MGDIPAPFDAYRDVVRPEWIDDNGHMNMGYYVVVFDLATDEWMRFVGLDRAHRRAREVTTFCLEAHITYHQEVREQDPLRFTTRLLDFDAKRIHYFEQLFHAEEGWLSATSENMTLHVDMGAKKVAPLPETIMRSLAAMKAAHDRLPRPQGLGRRIAMPGRG